MQRWAQNSGFFASVFFASYILTPVSMKIQSLFSKAVEAGHLPQLETEHKEWRAKISGGNFFSPYYRETENNTTWVSRRTETRETSFQDRDQGKPLNGEFKWFAPGHRTNQYKVKSGPRSSTPLSVASHLLLLRATSAISHTPFPNKTVHFARRSWRQKSFLLPTLVSTMSLLPWPLRQTCHICTESMQWNATTVQNNEFCFTKTVNLKDIIHLILGFFFLYMEASVRN